MALDVQVSQVAPDLWKASFTVDGKVWALDDYKAMSEGRTKYKALQNLYMLVKIMERMVGSEAGYSKFVDGVRFPERK